VIGDDYLRPKIRLPGSVGIGDMAAYYCPLYAYVTRHNPRAFPARVDFVSAPGTLGSERERVDRGLRWGRAEAVFTDLCTFEFDPSGRMRVSSIHPYADAAEVEAATGFEVECAEVVTDPPTERELGVLDAVDPGRLRDLEFVGAAERRQLIEANLAATNARKAAESAARGRP
jgi:glutaconate CoA-transferase subunit B